MIVYECKLPSGVTVRIDTSLCAPRGSEQEKQIIKEQRRVAHEILVNAAGRQEIVRTNASA